MRKTLAALAAAATVASGCGGGDDKPKTKAEFIEQADKACVGSALRPKAPPQTIEQAAQQTDEEARARKDLQAKLEDIEAPEDVRADYQDFLKRSRDMIAGLERMSQLARQRKLAEYDKAGEAVGRVGVEREQVADRIGFKKCGQPFTPEERRQQQK